MKKLNGIALAVAAIGTVWSAGAAAQITGSKHDFANTANSGGNQVTATPGISLDGEICVFCHTPHAAANAIGAPLWNKTMPATTYTLYTSGSMSSSDASLTGGSSLACLSCHDGTQAMDNLINAPGSGGLDATGGGANGRNFTWTSGNGRVTADGAMLGVANLGANLANDHPIGIRYCGLTATAGATITPATDCNDSDFNIATQVGATDNWFVDVTGVGTGGSRDKTDMQLYARGGDTVPRVECGSCHDPHAGGNNTFLRVNNTNSQVCLTCHTK